MFEEKMEGLHPIDIRMQSGKTAGRDVIGPPSTIRVNPTNKK